MMMFPSSLLPGAQGGHLAPIFLAVERQSGEVGDPFSLGNLKALEDHRERAACRLLQDCGEAGRGASSCRFG